MANYFFAPPKEINGVTIGVERLLLIIDEVREVHQTHWDETERVYHEYDSMDPNYGAYVAAEDDGEFIIFTVRNADGKLVGNLAYNIGMNLHMKGVKEAMECAFFLLPEYRNGGIAGALLDYAESLLVSFGVRYLGMNDKSPSGGVSLEPLMRRKGYRPASMQYIKKVGD